MDRIAVLVVDDEEQVRTFLAELLGSSGYQVRCASSGAQALEMLAGGSFDAVLLDVMMPEMSGLEVLRRYRSTGGSSPVIVLSALAGAEDAMRAMKLGASDYLSKPFGNDELEDALARALGARAPVRSAPWSARRRSHGGGPWGRQRAHPHLALAVHAPGAGPGGAHRRHGRARCCCWGSPARARRSSPARSTRAATGATGRSSR
jgi:CheY-like chemotaxis protein